MTRVERVGNLLFPQGKIQIWGRYRLLGGNLLLPQGKIQIAGWESSTVLPQRKIQIQDWGITYFIRGRYR